jgi:hypothetical protein
MSRYIDADALKEQCYKFANDVSRSAMAFVQGQINSAPTADVVEVRHGEWIEKDDGWDGVLYTCSVCKCDWTTIDGTPFENNMRYCPECGAKMDIERSDNGT